MVDFAQSGINNDFSFHLVDPWGLNEIGEISMLPSACGITNAYYGTNIQSAKLTAVNDPTTANGIRQLIRVKLRQTYPDGSVIDDVMGTFFIKKQDHSAIYKKLEKTLDCYSTLLRFTEDILVGNFYRPQGYNVVSAIRDIVEADGGKLVVGRDVDGNRTFGQGILLETGMNRAEAIRTMAGWIGCQIGVSTYGYITLEPYVRPIDKPITYTFDTSNNCVYKPGFTMTDNEGQVYNRCRVYYSVDNPPEGYPQFDYAFVGLDPSHPWSYQRTGRYSTADISLPEPVPHADLLSKAQAYLEENSGSILYVTISHPYITGLRVGDVVRYINDVDHPSYIDMKFLVTQINVRTLSGAGMCETKLKAVSGSIALN